MDDPGMDYETLTGTKSQARIDDENLRLLVLFHYILGPLIALFSCIAIFHIVLGSLVVGGGWILGALTAYAGRCLKVRKNYIFICVIEGLLCGFVMPLGTVLGVFTLIVLMRPSVKEQFQRGV